MKQQIKDYIKHITQYKEAYIILSLGLILLILALGILNNLLNLLTQY